jgi:Protein of unknown function (DUF3606)
MSRSSRPGTTDGVRCCNRPLSVREVHPGGIIATRRDVYARRRKIKPGQLRMAVKKVGSSVAAVERELKGGNTLQPGRS